MTDLQQYIKEKYNSSSEWFIDFVNEYTNQSKVNKVEGLKSYLSGNHKILHRQNFKHNGKEYEARKIVLNYAKTILSFMKSYLLQTPITLIGDEKVVKEYKKVIKQGKYDRLNMKILDKVLKYGDCFEYVYMDKAVIKSKIIGADEGFPLYNEVNEMIGFVQFFMSDGIDYYTVYEDDVVSQYDNKGGKVRLTGRYANLSGLPVVYKSENELSETEGRSELEDWISILDNMESLLSKQSEATEKFLDPVFLSVGQTIKETLPADIIGKGINLDDGGEAKYLQAQLDVKSFETTYKALQSSLLDISSTPSVSMNKTDISNLSEVSIRLLFSLANVKAGMNEQFMREGIEDRFDKIRKLLEYKGIVLGDDEFNTLNHVYHYAMPSNDKEIIENLKSLKEMNSISTETVISKTPYIQDVAGELDKLKDEGLLGKGEDNPLVE
ncbi:phage portal protein [Bacillus sp. Hm123]|uniref:phage portal protein n=1 Tax=Bacillus sp. Hm123 TaxID=3450745 RepID=UPI003F424CE2